MKFFGQLEEASLEQLSSDPIDNTQGRIFQNTTEGRTKIDDGVSKKALLRNDDKMIIGNDGTAANNARVHKSTNETIQIARGDDTTAEGVAATLFGQLGARSENFLNAGLPAAGNIGRKNYITDQKVEGVDDGVNWRRVIPEHAVDDSTSGASVELASITSSLIRLTGAFTTLETIPAGFSSQRVTLINRTGSDVSVSNNSGATAANRILTGLGANIVLKQDAALNLYYDSTTSRWQVIGEAAGSAGGGGQLPSSTVVSASSNYTVLITDDIILVDATSGIIELTLPSAAGNIGKVFKIEKTAGDQRNAVTLVGTVDGITNIDINALNAPFEIVSDGSTWKSISEAAGSLFLGNPVVEPTVVAVASTGNVVLESLAVNSVINGVEVKEFNEILLKNQSVSEENGVYSVPSVAQTISAYSNADEDISLIANGSVVNVTVVSTGQLISLRFQTDPQENGVYVVGATAGTTVRDTSLRSSNFLTPSSFKDLILYSDYYNYIGVGTSTTYNPNKVGSITSDRTLFKQSNYNIINFADMQFTQNDEIINIKVPSNVNGAIFELCGAGGSGGGGSPGGSRGGTGGAGATGFSFFRRLTPGSNITMHIPIGSIPGSGINNSGGTAANPVIVTYDTPDYAFGVLSTQAYAAYPGNPSSGGAAPAFYGTSFYFPGGTFAAAGTSSQYAPGGNKGAGSGLLPGGGGGGGYSGYAGRGGQGSSASGIQGASGKYGSGRGCGGGGGGYGPPTGGGKPGRGGFGGPGFVRVKWI